MDILRNHLNWPEIVTNGLIIVNLMIALLLGLLVGYERAYHGRAAGMRTYGMVCMASAALVLFAGYPEFWFGGHFKGGGAIDPTRIVQGIITGIGFLGAGVIMKDGISISGLTTAASIWASSAIGVLVGLGFYISAIALTAFSSALMLWGGKLEGRLPSHPAIAIILRFAPGYQKPDETIMRRQAFERGYVVADGSFSVHYEEAQLEWHFVAIAIKGNRSARITDLGEELSKLGGVVKFHISHARN